MSTERRYLMLGGDIGPLQVLTEIQDLKGRGGPSGEGTAHSAAIYARTWQKMHKIHQ